MNITLLRISLTLLKESVDFFVVQKRTLLDGREDEDEEEDDDDESNSELSPQKHPKTKGRNLCDEIYSV